MGEVNQARLALSTGSLYNWALDRVFQLAASTGYDGVELLVDARMDSYDVPYLRSLIDRWRTPILSVHTPFVSHLEAWPDNSEGRVEYAVRLAEDLGAEIVVAHPPRRWHSLSLHGSFLRHSFGCLLPWPNRAERRYAQWLCEELFALEKGSSVRVALENMPAKRRLGYRISDYLFSSMRDLKRWPHLVLDTTHWGTWGIDPVQSYQALGERVIHVHLSDYDGREHRLPFTGSLGLDKLLSALRENAFSGIVCIEVHPDALAGGDWRFGHMRSVLSDIAKRVAFLLGIGLSHSQDNSTNYSPLINL